VDQLCHPYAHYNVQGNGAQAGRYKRLQFAKQQPAKYHQYGNKRDLPYFSAADKIIIHATI
jgi:hypothetical protein